MLSTLSFDQFRYTAIDDLWIICCYFNSANYISMPRKFALFQKSLQNSNLNFIAVECAFEDQPFSLTPKQNVIQVRSNSVLWQKERLLNLALSRLPKECKKVAWVDADVFFLNAGWAVEASQLLEEYPVVQLFERMLQQLPEAQINSGQVESQSSFAYLVNEEPESFNADVYAEHGHTGFGWACRREILEAHGHYDRMIVGGADHAFAHASVANFSCRCLHTTMLADAKQMEPFLAWAEPFYGDVRGRIGYVPGTVVHTWHGTTDDRQYAVRHTKLIEFGFDPQTDLRLNANGCWEWNSDKPLLHSYLRQYFATRFEDG